MTVAADSNGRIDGTFTVPPEVPAGSKLVEFIGTQTRADATFVGRGTLKTEELRMVNSVVNRRLLTWKNDPLAQTFILDSDYQVAAVDLWFCDIGPTNVLMQIRDVALGVPTLDVVAETLLTPAEITTDGPTRFKFPPVVLEADREYAIVLACNDAISSVAIGELGQFDAENQQWVTSQPYQIGVLLSSSNNRTWTPHQTKDLTFRLLAADYNVETNTTLAGETTRTVALDDADVVDADQLVVFAAVERPTSDTNVVFNVGVGGTTYTVIEGQTFTLAARYTGTVTLEAVLSGTYTSSPRLHRDVHLLAGKRLESSDYVSRAMQCAGGTKLTLYYNALMPGAASVDAFYEDDEGAWVPLPIIEGTELGNGWLEVKREFVGIDQPETRIKLTLNGSARALPKVKNLRVAVI